MLRSFQFQRRIKLIHRQYFSPQGWLWGLVRVVTVSPTLFHSRHIAALQLFTGIKFWFQFYSASGVTDPEAKREREVKTIGTHDGTFRCREALACYMLKVLPEYKDARYAVMLLCSTVLYTYCHSGTMIPGNITSSLPRIVTSVKHK